MTTIVAGSPLNMSAFDLTGLFLYDFSSFTSTTARFFDSASTYTEFTGTGFTESGGIPTGGTVTGATVVESGVTVLTVSGASISAVDLYNLALVNDFQTLFNTILAGNDTITGSDGADTLGGYGGNDVLHGGLGDDVLRGGAGIDQLFGDGGADKLFGDGGNDVLHGGLGNDVLHGGLGADQLFGDGGADKLFGDGGPDILTGGLGNDQFIFNHVLHSRPGALLRDVITDFTVNLAADAAFIDRISVVTIDAMASTDGNQNFTFIGTAGFTAEGQVRVIQLGLDTRVLFNTTGVVGSEMEILLANFTATTLTASDFIL